MKAVLVAAVAALLASAAGASAASLQPIGEFESPVYVTSEPSDPERLLVVEQGGRIVLSHRGTQSTFLDLTEPDPDLLVSGGERGLFSVALDPSYEQTGLLYVFYTRNGSGNEVGDLQIDEFTASGDSAPLASRRPVLTIDHETFGNHNGGQLQFGPDGHLYIATGDGGSGDDPFDAGQSLTTMLGKILRIDPHQSGGSPYTIPSGNPFVDGPGPQADEIWSYGLRNPWRFSFDRLTGDLLLGDVGQGAWEEVDFDPAPRAGRAINFGWDCREGPAAHSTAASCPGPFTNPIHAYPNPPSGPASVTGGYVVRDPGLVGDLYGRYLYADVYSGPLRSLIPALPSAVDSRDEPLSASLPVSFGEDSCGRVYVVSALGSVFRLVGDAPTDCSTSPPNPAPDPPPSNPAASCHGSEATLEASAGEPSVGTAGRDVIVGTTGADRLRGLRGHDLICGFGGADVLRGSAGADELRGGPGDDRCRGGGRDRRGSC